MIQMIQNLIFGVYFLLISDIPAEPLQANRT